MSPIRDPIHGYIEIAPHIEKLLDTRIVQRLRSVKQLGWVNLVYPGANHTRFEHSLGTYYLASRLGSEIRYHPSYENPIAGISRQCRASAIAGFLRELAVARSLAQHPLNPKLFIEDILLRYRSLTTAP